MQDDLQIASGFTTDLKLPVQTNIMSYPLHQSFKIARSNTSINRLDLRDKFIDTSLACDYVTKLRLQTLGRDKKLEQIGCQAG